MEFLDTIIGGALVFFAYAAGARRERGRKGAKGQICGCKHHRSYHENGEGSCNYNAFDYCACKKYIGPRTLDDLVPED